MLQHCRCSPQALGDQVHIYVLKWIINLILWLTPVYLAGCFHGVGEAEWHCVRYAPLKMLLYFLLSALGLMVCVLAAAFAAHHYSQLAQVTCGATLNSCHCKLPSSEPLSRSFVYRDVTDCTSITGTFKLFLVTQMILNLVCGLVCLLACFVMWKHRYQVFYVGDRMHSLSASEVQQQKV